MLSLACAVGDESAIRYAIEGGAEVNGRPAVCICMFETICFSSNILLYLMGNDCFDGVESGSSLVLALAHPREI